MGTVIFHADLDAFYASVEQRDHPEYRGLPVIVGARPGHRGVVSACSYEARAFGVHSAMPISQAVKRCPEAIFRPVDMHRYQEVSQHIMEVFADFSPVVRRISVDEAFLDMSGTTSLFGQPREAAAKLKARVREEVGLNVSVGIGTNRYTAKLASARSKPDGLLEITPGSEETFLASLPLSSVWGVGDKTLERLVKMGLDTVPRIQALNENALDKLLGRGTGNFLYHAVRGQDPGIFSDEPRSRSMSVETTYEHDVSDEDVLRATILEQSQEIMFRLLEENCRSRTIHMKLRYDDFETISAQETLDRWIISAEDIRFTAISLLEKRWNRARAVRLLGIGVANLQSPASGDQGELFPNPTSRQAAVEHAILELKKRKGAVVTKALLIKGPSTRSRPN